MAMAYGSFHKRVKPPSFHKAAIVIGHWPELILIESFSSFTTEQAGSHHLAEQGMRTVLRVAELFVQHFHDGEIDVVTNEVGQSQRTHRVVGAQHHALVDVLSAGDAIELENVAFGKCFATDDQKEGMAAFLEKRPAKFVGK